MTDLPDEWDQSQVQIPAPYTESLPTTFAFIPSHAKRKTAGNDPYRLSVVKLLRYAPGDAQARSAGTGVFIDKDILLTAGHVVFDPYEFGTARAGGYAEYLELASPWFPIPRNNTRTVIFAATNGWTSRRDPGHDLAIIKLRYPVANVLPLIPQEVDGSDISGKAVKVYGFPAIASQPYTALGKCVAASTSIIYHLADASEGCSGGPLLLDMPNGATFSGLHRAGPGETPSNVPDSVSAFRITAPAVSWIQQMRAQIAGG